VSYWQDGHRDGVCKEKGGYEMATISDKIEHIVVLMLENRSFDSVLGKLYPTGPGFDGLTGNETNPLYGGGDVEVWNNPGLDTKSMSIPDPDPGELWNDINMQLFGLGRKPGIGVPHMDGFVDNYVRQKDQPASAYDPKAVMHHYTPDQLPALSTLAKAFAVCDRWFASAPCQTWPNRFFLHCATAGGYENNSPIHPPYLMRTIFNRMSEKQRDWRIYYHDFPQSLTLSDLWAHLDRFKLFDDFVKDAGNGGLPAYTFIEPRYFPGVDLPNDQHPPHHVGLGDELVAKVYNAVRHAPTWEKTLLIILYDEHGGLYDHVAPPAAVAPDNSDPRPFGFDRYGVRVPAVLISPYIKAGTVLRPPAPTNSDLPAHPFDHTSVIATLRKCFDLGGPLTHRDAVAPDLESVLELDTPDNPGPESVQALPYTVSETELKAALAAPLNGFQKAIHEVAAHLPDLSALHAGESVFSAIEDHIALFVHGLVKAVPDHRTAQEAQEYVASQLEKFLKT